MIYFYVVFEYDYIIAQFFYLRKNLLSQRIEPTVDFF